MPKAFYPKVLLGSLALTGAIAALAQDYPNRTIRIYAIGPGGSSDIIGRLIAQGLSGGLGQAAVVDNRGGNIPSEIVARSAPDGYSLLVGGGNTWVAPLFEKTAYDPVRDFSPIALVATTPIILVVHPSLPVKSVKDLIALAKAKPGQLNIAGGTTGGAPQIGADLFNYMAGVKIVRVPYKNTGIALSELMGGEVQLMWATAASVMAFVHSGRLRAVAVGGIKRSALVPELPTVADSGLPGFELGNSTVFFSPAKTADTIVRLLSQETIRLLNHADVKDKVTKAGAEVIAGSPEQLAAAMQSDLVRIGRMVKATGIKAE